MKQLFIVAPAVCCLLIINIAMFLLTMVKASPEFDLRVILGLYYFDSPRFSAYQIITHMFMHGNVPHIVFNMFALFSFGVQLEALWGSKRFLIFYAVTGLGAVLLHQCVQVYEVYQIAGSITPGSDVGLLPGYEFSGASSALNAKYFVPVIGASGAIYGVLLGFAVLFPNAKLIFLLLPIPVKAKYLIPVMMLLELYLGVHNFSVDNIAHFAHLGGALFGFILVKMWMKSLRRQL